MTVMKINSLNLRENVSTLMMSLRSQRIFEAFLPLLDQHRSDPEGHAFVCKSGSQSCVATQKNKIAAMLA